MSNFTDLTGQKFGRLTVIKRGEDLVTSRKYIRWECNCDCGKKGILVTTKDLKSGHTKSCGCYKRDITIKRNQESRKNNKYDLSGDYGIGWTSNTNEEFYFDLEDYDKIKDYCWSSYQTKRNNHIAYVCIMARINNDNITPMSEIITGKKFQDHIDHNTFNNKKSNLRDSTYRENNKNKKISIKNKSGVTGVNRYDDTRWRSRICVDYKEIDLGIYDDFEEAVKARLEAEKIYFGEFAPQQHLYEQYEII